MQIEVDGEQFEAITAGPDDGPVALFLHGFPDLPQTWSPVMERFAKQGYRCVAPYLRGYAPSTTAGPFDLFRLGRDVAEMAHALSRKAPVVALGHDWGAAALWLAASRWPQRFAVAVPVSVPHWITFVRAMRSPAQLWRSRYMAALQVASIDRAGIERLWRRWSPDLTPPAEHLDAVAQTIADSADAPLEYYRAIRRPSRLMLLRVVDAERAKVTVPTLYLHGLDDGCIAPSATRGQERWVDAPFRAEIIVGAGHFVPLEQPDAVAERALRFAQTYGPTRPNRIGVRT